MLQTFGIEQWLLWEPCYDLMFNEMIFIFLWSTNWIFSSNHQNDHTIFHRQSNIFNTFPTNSNGQNAFSNKNYLPKLNNGKIPISFHMHLAKEQKIRSLLFLLSISFSLKKSSNLLEKHGWRGMNKLRLKNAFCVSKEA